MAKNLPVMWETWVRSLDREEALEQRMDTCSMDRGAWLATVHGVFAGKSSV